MFASLERKERKVIIISLMALLVAGVTYGLLGSTGTFKNSSYNLGGAIVGFIIVAGYLNRVYGKDSTGIPRSELKGAKYFSEESVKILDMRSQNCGVDDKDPSKPPNKVVLVDHYKLKILAEIPRIEFEYATNGIGMEGKSLSTLSHKWRDLTSAEIDLGEDRHLKRQYKMELDTKEIAKGQIVYVDNVVTYVSAFEGKTKDFFHTHVNLPTKSLTIILQFPELQLCKSVVATEKIGRNPAVEVDKDRGLPILVEDGSLVHWRIATPRLGAAYKLEWEW